MKFTQIRNATIIVEYNNTKFLFDPVLSKQGSMPAFSNSIRQDAGNPTVPLPLPINEVLDVDAVIITHLHRDHFDEAAKNLIPKDMKIFVQNNEDYEQLKLASFTNLEILSSTTEYNGIQLIKAPGQHGWGEILKFAGHVCGIVMKHPNEKTTYVLGDTVWYEAVEQIIDRHTPEIVITNNGDNRFLSGEQLIFSKEDLLSLHEKSPTSTLIASHMEAINHWTLSREDLLNYTIEKGFSSSVLIPNDGQSYEL